MIAWIKHKLGIAALEAKVRHLELKLDTAEASIACYKNAINHTLKQLKQFTKIDADVGIYRRSNNTIILTGTYRNKGYIRFYDMGDGAFKEMAEQIKEMSRYAEVRNIDEPYSFGFRGHFDLQEYR